MQCDKIFLDKYRQFVKLPTMVLRRIYRTLLGDCSSAEYASEVIVDERVTRALLDINDPDLVLDLGRSNGKPNFDTFWCELQSYLDEINPAVDERRHGDTLHMPFAISVRHLQEIIFERLQQKFPNSMPPIFSQRDTATVLAIKLVHKYCTQIYCEIQCKVWHTNKAITEGASRQPLCKCPYEILQFNFVTI